MAVWQKLDEDLSVILEHSLRGQVETKLNCFGDILYKECRGRFGVVAGKQRSGPKQKGRRERKIKQLVKRRRQLRKQWRKASREENLLVVWLDLANAYGSVPHQLIRYALDFFYIPVCSRDLVAKYFEDLQMCCTHQDVTTGWQQLEVGIAMGCSISPILLVAAFEIILIGARKMVGGVKLPSGLQTGEWLHNETAEQD